MNPFLFNACVDARKNVIAQASKDREQQRANARKIASERGFLRVTSDGYDLGANPDPDSLLPTVTRSTSVNTTRDLFKQIELRAKRSAAAKAAWARRREATK